MINSTLHGELAANHAAMLRNSAISDPHISVLLPDGTPRYRTERGGRGLREFGFSEAQTRAPGLLISYRDATGAIYRQYRPDKPGKDRPKYETPYGKATYGLDIPEGVRDAVLDGAGELWITEGAKKADAGVSAGLVCVSLPGVWMFNRNDVPLPDWDIIPLNGRIVVICYDSDAMTKESVYAALRRLSNLLKKRGAIVRYCYLPDDGESKTGLDDYLAEGHGVEALRGLVSDKLKAVATAPVKALIATLNRKCEGVATFYDNRVDFSGEATDKNTLFTLSEIFRQKHSVDKSFKFWAGDSYAALNLPHGSKEATVENAIGKGDFLQVREWARIARAFHDERDYFREAAPWWFLELMASRGEEEQDAMLQEYLQRTTESESRMTRDELRERLHGKPEKKPDENERHPHGQTGGMAGQALSALIMQARAEDRAALSELNRLHGSACVSVIISELLPDGLHWILEQAGKLLQQGSRVPFPGEEIEYEKDIPSAFTPNTIIEVTFEEEQEPAKVTAAVTFQSENEDATGGSKVTAAVTFDTRDEIEKFDGAYAVVSAALVGPGLPPSASDSETVPVRKNLIAEIARAKKAAGIKAFRCDWLSEILNRPVRTVSAGANSATEEELARILDALLRLPGVTPDHTEMPDVDASSVPALEHSSAEIETLLQDRESHDFDDLLAAADMNTLPVGTITFEDDCDVTSLKIFVRNTYKKYTEALRIGDRDNAINFANDLGQCRRAWKNAPVTS